MPTNAPRPSFLLVHGAWHRSGCWSLVREALAADGWTARTVDLPSAGPQRTPAAGMYDDADAIAAHLRRTEGRVIVVGHSYGGLPVTQAAAGEPATGHPAAAHLVYLAAYLPAEGDSLLSVHGRGSTAPEDEDLSGTAPVVFDDPRTSLFGDLPDDRAEDAVGRLVAQSRRSFQQGVTRAAWRTVPSTYVLCERDRALPPELQERMSARAAHVERLDTGHSPFLSAPAELAALLGGIGSAVAPASAVASASAEG
ncbi:alpha/beta hydrolase [Streptomyces sp. NBC_01795]|uniref:alpha/beta fold hydrolase n=1 Tax=unclassified Streptomyces TaxID=2593676 RepID=UPI002DD8D9AF|nr:MULTISPECIES: alpha/beta fold hydrolase [unclassified Streptomyces]WSA92984.1 alpha/beta hydrolase [Streptomyces sp. NBC_01795]WSB77353.1 alpha/beta hydrolase [Streptomyces sp. NBC_01775]